MNPEPPETSEILAFVLAVDEGSVSGASRVLAVPRATVSRRLARLEERLGVRLLHRTTRELSLTEAGEEYYAYGRAVLDAVNVATAAVQRPGDEPRGRLRVSVMPTGNAVFREMLLLFAEAYPLVDLEIIVAAAMLDLREGKVDVALRASADLDADLIARKLLTSRMGAFASPAYLARQGTPIDPGQLARHACLLGFAGGERAATHWPLMEGGEVRVVGRLVSNDIALLRDAAVRGLGIALLPAAYSAARVADGSLVPVLPDHVGAVSTVALVYPDRRFLKPAVRAFVEHVVVHFPRMLLSLDAAGPDGEGAGVAAGPLAGRVGG